MHCRSRAGKRACPALDGSICGPCCGAHRVVRIRCPATCPYLVEGSNYQKDRRAERGMAKGRDYLAERVSRFGDDEESFAYTLAIEETLHRFRETHASLRDRDAREAVRAVKIELGGLAIPYAGPPEIAALLREEESHLAGHYHGLTRVARRTCLEEIEASIGRHEGDDPGGRHYLEFIGAYFREIAPHAGIDAHGHAGGPRETPSGLILP